MNSEERDSQLSAMFDDQLPAAECELLTRRLMRDEALKASWGRYATVGAAMRKEPLAFQSLRCDVARRVRAELEGEPQLDAPAVRQPGRIANWYKGALGTAIAAGVAAASILMLRVESPQAPATAAVLAPAVAGSGTASPAVAANLDAAPRPANRSAETAAPSYVVPPSSEQSNLRTSVQLANYVVAHSEYAAPVVRLNRLSSFMTSDIDADDEATEVVPVNAQSAR
ncbi:MAG: sigma-E factor negative regulatory protein [Steroidobacteraceae bacterium]